MTERLADIGTRIEGVRQLGAVVNAMRGIAAARVQQARGQLTAVDRYAATIAAAIHRALPLVRPAEPPGSHHHGRPGLVLFCAEQGFAGAFSQRVLDAAGTDLATAELFLIGTRGAAVALERGIAAGWTSPMPSHSSGVPKLADSIADALYARIAAGAIERLDAVFARRQTGQATRVERSRLFPLDPADVPGGSGGSPPLLNLSPGVLVHELTAAWLHALLCAAALHSFAAENESRMAAMEAARTQIQTRLDALRATQRQVRQQEITAEIIELAAGESASRP